MPTSPPLLHPTPGHHPAPTPPCGSKLPDPQRRQCHELLTGHDADLHCRNTGEQCSHIGVAIDFARRGAPDPTRPILVLDASDQDLVRALAQPAARARNTVEGPGQRFPMVVQDPTYPTFQTLVLTTRNFSAIAIASDSTCGGCDLNTGVGSTPHSDAINAPAMTS